MTNMTLHGKNLIGSELSALGQKKFYGTNPQTSEPLPTAFCQATEEEIDRALNLAADAFLTLRDASPERISAFLEAIARELESLGDVLIEQTVLETGLRRERLVSERTRTTNQLQLFAELVRDGSYLDARIDLELPDRTPPRPDLRRMLIPVGPVVVFGASNFPLAFSVAGGDTASAFAAKNPVVVKGHPAHPGTSELLAGVISRAVAEIGLPEGTFSMVHAVDPEISIALVQHPAACAVAFTGSERAGRAIFDAAAQRSEPIPAYVEMGSVNPVFVLPGAVREQASEIASGLSGSINLAAGQFCTCPGLVIGVEDAKFREFGSLLAQSMEKAAPGSMVHSNVLKGYEQSLARVRSSHGIQQMTSPQTGEESKTQAAPVLFETDVQTWLVNEQLSKEVFGPSAIVVRGQNEDELLSVATSLPGSLTATIHGTPDDLKQYRRLIKTLETKAGRIIFNGYPTGVEVSHAMHHAGPYPATTDPKFTSVGTAAILRFLRPVCYQNFPASALPAELQDENPRGIWRMVNGEFTREPVKRL